MKRAAWLWAAAISLSASPSLAAGPDAVTIRGKTLALHVYGPADGPPVVLTSGDLGWAGFVVHVGELLGGHGFRVIGISSKEYLSAFTTASSHLTPEDVPGDYAAVIGLAAGAGGVKPVLAGVSEGAGLSVLAAAAAGNHDRVAGVLGLGLPDENEIAWRWRDWTIWLTKKSPKEPTFHVSEFIARLAPVPLAAIHATHDEFVPLEEIRQLIDRAAPPKRLWLIDAANHRFSDRRDELDRDVLEAMTWIRQQATPGTRAAGPGR